MTLRFEIFRPISTSPSTSTSASLGFQLTDDRRRTRTTTSRCAAARAGRSVREAVPDERAARRPPAGRAGAGSGRRRRRTGPGSRGRLAAGRRSARPVLGAARLPHPRSRRVLPADHQPRGLNRAAGGGGVRQKLEVGRDRGALRRRPGRSRPARKARTLAALAGEICAQSGVPAAPGAGPRRPACGPARAPGGPRPPRPRLPSAPRRPGRAAPRRRPPARPGRRRGSASRGRCADGTGPGSGGQRERRRAGSRGRGAQHVDGVHLPAGVLAQRLQERRAERRGQIPGGQLRGHPGRVGVGEHDRVRGEPEHARVARRRCGQHRDPAVRGREAARGHVGQHGGEPPRSR